MVSLIYLSNFWRTLEMPLINCELNMFLAWSEKCVLVTGHYDDKKPQFAISDTKHYVPFVTLSAQDNAELFWQLNKGFKRTINWNKYQSKPTLQTQNRYLNYFIDPSFWGVNRLFVLSFENDANQRSYRRNLLPTVEIKDYK